MNYTRYIPLALFSLYAAKLFIKGFDLYSVGALAVLGTVSVLFEFKGENKNLSAITASYKELKETLELIKKDHENLKTHVAGLKMGRELRQIR